MPGLIRMTALVHPFKNNPKSIDFEEGVTIKDMIDQAQPDARQIKHVRVFCRGDVIPRETWHKIKPKDGDIIEVRAFPVPTGGGGGGGGKDITRIILTIAVIALAAFSGGAALGLLGFTSTQIAASGMLMFASSMISGIVATVGMLAVNALCPVKSPKLDQLSQTSGTTDSQTLYIDGARNSLNPFGVVPQVLGKYRSTPPMGSKPYTEIIGDNNYIRMLFIWGIGPLSIDTASLKVGDTLLTNFSDYQIEHREGYATDQPLTLFPSAISQEDFTILLKQVSGWITRTTTVYADEIGVDLSFPSGLVEFDAAGNKNTRSVNVEIEYRQTGTSPWLKIDTSGAKYKTTFDASWESKTGASLNSVTFSQRRTSGIRHGIRWGVASRGQYDIRIRRVTADVDSTTIADATVWSSLRSITAEDPVQAPFPLAMTVLAIKATDQLNGVIDEFSGVVTTVCKDWDSDTSTWIVRATQNPASLFRHVLQGNGISEPLADARIDLDCLQDWHDFCVAKGFKFNMVRDFTSSVWETLADVANAGRAAPTQIDGKWGVVIDQVQAYAVSYVTPRNSFGFKASKFFLNVPHGWRIRFSNEDQGYAADERRVYRDGYSDVNATKFESLELPGITDPDQVFKLGRFRLAQALNQPERWTFNQDMEFLTYKRGSRINISHDVLLVGLGQGRIVGVVGGVGEALRNEDGTIITNEDGTPVCPESEGIITGIILDEEVTMEAGKDYGVIIRTPRNGNITAQIVTEAGTTKNLTFTTPIVGAGSPPAQAIHIGDICGFGLHGLESDDASVIAILPTSNMTAQIICIPYRPAIYSADTEEIPAFDTKVTPLATIPEPSVRTVVSDETVMVVSSTGTLRMRVAITFDPLNTKFSMTPALEVQMRHFGNNEPFFPAVVEDKGEGYVFIGDVRTGEVIDIRLRFAVQGALPGPWTTITGHTVVGKATLPSELKNMTISAFGAQAFIRWDAPTELDVIFGGKVEFRHSQLMTGAEWGESTSIGQAAFANSLFAVLPLKEGTYFARVYDVDGNPAETITSVSTKQISVHEFENVTTVDEAPTFPGTHDDTVVASNNLQINDGVSPKVYEGSYTFSQGIDLTTVQRVRLTTRLTVSIFNVNDTIDSRLSNIDDWEDFDASLIGGADARVYVRHTDTDPAASPVVWTAWERLDSAEFEARAFQFKMILDRESVDYNINVSELGVDVEKIV
jgi:sulfur carrier protein ThiS